LRVFIAMRYWHPMSPETAAEVKLFEPDEVVLLPLYPQFSTTTTASSVDAWRAAAAAEGIEAPTRALCCYPTEPGFVAAHAGLIRPALDQAAAAGRPRLLFSAHGLPKKIIDRGDPYAWQIEQGAAAVAAALGHSHADLDWQVCYQSRVGPLEWIGPSIEQELTRAGRDGVPVVVTPFAFVSEHSETLVELDIEYREFAEKKGVPAYFRVATLGTDAAFIAALAALVRRTIAGGGALCSQDGGRLCPAEAAQCFFALGKGGR
jgi:ferrochelatase